MPVPTQRTMEAHVYLVGCLDEFVRQAGAAARAEDDPGVAKGAIDILVPPALVPEFHHVPPCRIELVHDRGKPGLGISVARRELKEKAPHPLTEDVGNDSEVAYQCFSALELLDM